MLRLLHTADWHLGHTLHGASRAYEHSRFLEWLSDTLAAHSVDVLLVAGDVFDSANPPAKAQRAFFSFLAECRRRLPELDVVVIAGNHDSPARLEAPSPLLEAFRIHTVGALPRREDRSIDVDRLLVPLAAAGGAVEAWCATIPFLRPQDLPARDDGDTDPLIDGARRVHEEIFAAARERLASGEALVAVGHCYMVGTQISELSERKVLGGNQHALPSEIFPDDLAYVGLGHLHRAQSVGSRFDLRYSGAPLPLSLAEGAYDHQVILVELDGSAPPTIQRLSVPRAVEILRVPEDGPAPLAEVLELLGSLDRPADVPAEQQPFVEARVLLDKPEPSLRHEVASALDDVGVRLLRVSPSYADSGSPLADATPEINLDDLDPEEVFDRRHQQVFGSAPSAELLEAFHELLEDVRGDEP